jgi:hypothetical protein
MYLDWGYAQMPGGLGKVNHNQWIAAYRWKSEACSSG